MRKLLIINLILFIVYMRLKSILLNLFKILFKNQMKIKSEKTQDKLIKEAKKTIKIKYFNFNINIKK